MFDKQRYDTASNKQLFVIDEAFDKLKKAKK